MLKEHGWIGCRRCFTAPGREMYLGTGEPAPWRLEATAAAWGSSDPEIVVLGFSKGANQSRDLPFEQVPFNGMWDNLTRILRALGLLESSDRVERHFGATENRFHFGSLVRCSVAMWDARKQGYTKSGGQILERFLKDRQCRPIAATCARTYLGHFSDRTRLVVMLGNSNDYVRLCRERMQEIHPDIQIVNSVAYGSDKVTWVHTIHPKAQGRHVPDWLSGEDSPVGRKFAPALQAVRKSGLVH